MKKIFCLLGLLIASNVHAGIDLDALFSGKTSYTVCYLFAETGDPTNSKNVGCGNKGMVTVITPVKKPMIKIIADFVGLGWDLATTFMGNSNQTVFVFTKK